MNIELLPFQQESLQRLRVQLAESQTIRKGMQNVLSLSAPTGSGKTIIMAALMESVLYGTGNLSPRDDSGLDAAAYAAQPEAVFLWLSDAPELNEQSRDKINKHSKIGFVQSCIIEPDFDQETLTDGTVYFLNTQKLSKRSLLAIKGNSRDYTLWQTLSNTVRDKGERFFIIIDEAHRGAQKKTAADSAEDRTIVQKN